jgi:hypothetical protein
MMATHQCPIDGCDVQVPPHLLMCRSHWRRVPKELQRRVYDTYANGTGLMTEEYEEARSAAIAAVEMKEAA